MQRLDVHRWLPAVLVTAVALSACATSDPDDGTAGSGSDPATSSPISVTAAPDSPDGDSAAGGEGGADDAASEDSPSDTTLASARQQLTEAARVDLDPTGNRVITGAGSMLDTEPIEVTVVSEPRWIVPAGPTSWIAVLEDGSSVVIDVDDEAGASVVATEIELDGDAAQRPPLAVSDGIGDFDAFLDLFGDPLPDTRVVVADEALVALGGPTDRYPHGALGDAVEASTVEVVSPSGGPAVLVELDDPDVFEAVSPMIADVDGDGADEVVMTVSNGDSGARLVAYSLADGSVVAATDPIGLGNRWRSLLAVAPVGPGGETEIIDVQTPHIGGIVQFFRVDGDRMELVASTRTYSTHSIGSRNLDLGIVTDADGDGRLDVVVPTQDRLQLGVLTRDDSAEGGVDEVGRIDLGGRLATNVAAGEGRNGVRYAVGVDDATVLIWP